MPGSTFGGVIVPLCCDSRLLMSGVAGAIFSGGAGATVGGAACTVGLAGDAGPEVCAIAGAAVKISAVSKSLRNIESASHCMPPLTQ